MKSLKYLMAGLLLAGVTTSIAVAGGAVSVEGVKCLMVAKKDANEEKKSKWKDGNVYFCCDGCLGKYEKMSKDDKKKIAHKANHQLVATKQYVQGGCPFSGGELDKEQSIKVMGAEVGFCCSGCKSKAEKMSEEDQLTKLFGEEAFKKAKFKLAKKEK
jgi:hypothetical protein